MARPATICGLVFWPDYHILCVQVMNHPVGYPPPKRLPGKRKQARLNLRRSRPSAPDPEEIENQQTGHFWRWVGIVTLLHLVALLTAIWIYRFTPAPPPPEQFISLLPEG